MAGSKSEKRPFEATVQALPLLLNSFQQYSWPDSAGTSLLDEVDQVIHAIYTAK
jgi:hypothetical protein